MNLDIVQIIAQYKMRKRIITKAVQITIMEVRIITMEVRIITMEIRIITMAIRITEITILQITQVTYK